MDPELVRSEVVTLDAPGPIAARLARAGVPVRSLGGSGLAVAFARLARILRRERFDVVNAYGFKATVVARVLVRLGARRTTFVSGVRALNVTETDDLGGVKSRVALAIERVLSPLVDVYDSNSRAALDRLAGIGVDRRRLRFIPNGIDAERWAVDRGEGEPSLPPTILCVARFVPRKRHVDLVRAARVLTDSGIEFRLVLAGEGSTLDDVRRLVAELGLGDRVAFPGRVDHEQVSELLAGAAIFCLPSVWEGMPGSAMEAMAAGLPVVATRVSGVDELVEHERTGLLVPPRRPDLLAAALETLLRDPSRGEELGREGRNRIVSEFSVERMVGAKQDLYRGVATGAIDGTAAARCAASAGT
jgi:glycosyltransferase involved in cell wall biosynthesis